MKDINDKILELEEILKDSNKFDNYINKMENEVIQIPNDLNNKILNKITNFEKLKTQQKVFKSSMKNKYMSIIKIVACTVFAIFVWETSLASINPTIHLNNKNIYNNLDHKIKSINEVFMKDYNFREEK